MLMQFVHIAKPQISKSRNIFVPKTQNRRYGMILLGHITLGS